MASGRVRVLLVILVALCLAACSRGSAELFGWRALQPGMELSSEQGPAGQTVLALLYTIPPGGQDYAIERDLPAQGLEGRPTLSVLAQSTRVLFLAVVLVDREGREHECALTLLPGGWHELEFDFPPGIADWSEAVKIRFEDRTGGLGSQGPVSLKLIGLPL